VFSFISTFIKGRLKYGLDHSLIFRRPLPDFIRNGNLPGQYSRADYPAWHPNANIFD